MKLKYVVVLLIGIFIGWCTLPSAQAKEDNTYKGILREAITVLQQIQINTAQIAENTKALREKLGAK